jgi:16S rRNA (guanine527-N7)-methyltransferase
VRGEIAGPAGAGAERLVAGAAELGLPLDAHQVQALLSYARLLDRWGRAYNLTSVRGVEAIVGRHLLDSLSILPYLTGSRFLDVGTGAGLPGLVLAVAGAAGRWVLLDSVGKKARFCRQAVLELGLRGVEVAQVRLEDYRPEEPFDSVTARAWGPIGALLTLSGPLLRPGGRVLAMKGVYPSDELADPAVRGWQVEVVRLRVPGLEAERHLVVARRT